MDKYYTNPKIAQRCCSIISKKIQIDYEDDMIIEPSAGNGAFIQPIKKLCKNNLFLDISPENKTIKKQDFLTFYPEDNVYRKIHVIGNPPFGFKGSMAIKFIKRACTFCNTISFILPKSFAKDSMKKSVPLHFHLLYSADIPDNSFHYKEMIYDIPCIFQIWEKRKYRRKTKKKLLPNGYVFVKKWKDADLAIRRVGSRAGNIYFDDLKTKNVNSHYFIKLDNKNNKNRIHDLSLKSNDYVVGPKSISKYDIIYQLNNVIL